MQLITCSEHMTIKQKEAVDHRSLDEKRNLLKVGDTVFATSEYREVMSEEPDFEGGRIIEFNEPRDWAGKKALSQAYIQMPCGCTKYISTGWLTKVKPNDSKEAI